jgi:hypothetical protein
MAFLSHVVGLLQAMLGREAELVSFLLRYGPYTSFHHQSSLLAQFLLLKQNLLNSASIDCLVSTLPLAT